MSEPETDNDWLRLERDVDRLFSAAPLCAVGSLGNGPREELYLGRVAEVRLMVQAVHDPAKHVLLYGERGIGKTSLANTFWRQSNTSNFPILAARLQVNPFDDFSSLWSRALKEFQTVFRHYSAEICSTFAYVSPDIVRHEFQKIPRHLGAIMIVDEFDLLRDREARELTANLLKSLHDHAINVTVLLIGVAQNVEELISNHKSLRRVLSLVKLERVNTVDLGAILDSRLRLTSLEISTEARSEIVTLSCGLPYYVQILGKLAAQNAIEHHRLQVRVEDVTAAIENFLVEDGRSFSGDYQRATESRFASNIFRDVILASALTCSDPSGGFESSEVSKILNVIAPEKGYHHTRVQQRLAEFISDRRGRILIRSRTQARYRYCFADALMQPFIVMKAIKDGVIDEELRHLLFHSVKAEDHDKEYQIDVVEADTRQRGMIGPTVTEEAGKEIPNFSEARQARSELSRIAPAATIVVADTPFDRRLSPRRRVLEVGLIVFRYSTMDCVIHDTSDKGALLRPRDIVGCPTKFVLKPPVDPSRDCEAVWRKGEVLGVRYL
jgi:Cdc6-like AAA superfamily ATPase